MQFLIDFLPVAIFFVIYKLHGIYAAVIATAIASCLTTGYTWAKHKRLEGMQIASLVIILIAAALTILFRDDSFIKWKPTLINGLFAFIFAGSLLTRQSLTERLFGSQFECSTDVWRKLTISWTCFFILCAAANYYVAFIYQVGSEDLNQTQYENWQSVANTDLYAELLHQKPISELDSQLRREIDETPTEKRQQNYLEKVHQSRWVDFKLFGLLALTVIFVLGQGFFIARYVIPQNSPENEPDNKVSNIL